MTLTEGDPVTQVDDDEACAFKRAGRDGVRLSLAGAQDKLPVVFDGQRIGLPTGGQPSTHILKPAIAAVEDSVLNEGFCLALALARALGLPTAQAQISICCAKPPGPVRR
ncbi:MAG: hypothetical protein EBZ75_14765, partial [Oxalobacteraceae bacterium]|nr:hypothetical protein [Oxalobacteraceae bacterium]